MARTKHGMAHKHPAYDLWVMMRQRCNNPLNDAYHRYGAKGIKVCERWSSFDAFIADMGERPDGATVERIDGSLGYEPSNCRWATYSEQAKNRSMTVWVEFGGEKKCLSDWARDVGLTYSSLKERIEKWGVEKALTTPKFATKKRSLSNELAI